MKNPSEMSKRELLSAAEERIFYLGLRDLTSALAFENTRYGLARIMCALDSLDVFCLFAPDASITRTTARWMSGFGYGMIIRWPDTGLFFPELRPNACGMAIARLDNIPPRERLLDRLAQLYEPGVKLDGIKIKSDLGKSNHFFEFHKPLEMSSTIEKEMPKECYYAMVHASVPEMENELGGWVEKGEWIKTPLGKISVLDGDEGRKYYDLYNRAEDFCLRRREFLLKHVLPDCEIVTNTTHQGLFEKNEMRLGSYNCIKKTKFNKNLLFPIAMRWDAPTYIFRGRKNLSEETIERSKFKEKAYKLGFMDELKNANILPHGGGYTVEVDYNNIDVIETKIGNVFVLSGGTSTQGGVGPDLSRLGEMAFINSRQLPFNFRGIPVVEDVIEHKLSEPVGKLQPIMTLKV